MGVDNLLLLTKSDLRDGALARIERKKVIDFISSFLKIGGFVDVESIFMRTTE